MGLIQQLLLLASVLLIGCGVPAVSPPVASLADTPTAVAASGEHKPEPVHHTVLKVVAEQKVAAEQNPPTFPAVLLSAGHAKLCTVKVGDQFPALNLPRLGGPTTELSTLFGKQATVVLFWHPDRWMARTALADMQRDIASQFDAEKVAVVGIAVRQPTGAVQASLNKAQASFPQLIDTDGAAFATVGTDALPRLYVLDPAGKIVWFDIEYSEGTRRELEQTLRLLAQATNQ